MLFIGTNLNFYLFSWKFRIPMLIFLKIMTPIQLEQKIATNGRHFSALNTILNSIETIINSPCICNQLIFRMTLLLRCGFSTSERTKLRFMDTLYVSRHSAIWKKIGKLSVYNGENSS